MAGDDVDTTHLLGDHDDPGCKGCTTDAGNGEELEETDDISALGDDVRLEFEGGVDVVQVASDLDLVIAQPGQRVPRLGVAVLLDEPTGRLRAQVDQAQQWHSRDERGSKHVTPLVSHVVDGKVDDGYEEDAKRRTELPGHDEGTTDGSRRVLGGVHRNYEARELGSDGC